MDNVRNYYDILGLPRTATLIDIEKAYQRLSAQWHPDRHKDRYEAENKFHEINEAYETLSNPLQRKHYDLLMKPYSLQDADKSFEKFFEKFGIENENERRFLESNYPKRKKNFYEILGVQRNASLEHIKKAYRELAIKYHPKNNPGDQSAAQKFVEVNQAFDTLSDEIARRNYDDLIYDRKIAPVRAHDIFDNFWEEKAFEIPEEDDFFKPLMKKKISNKLDKMMESDKDWQGVNEGETVKTSTVYTVRNGVETKKTVSTRRVFENGIPVTTTTEEYDFPDGTREIRKIRDDGRGNLTTDVYNLQRGERLTLN